MALAETSSNVVSRHWLRMPAVGAAGLEYFVFSGIAIFSALKGTGAAWERGTAEIAADYSNIVAGDRAILLRYWTVDIHLASVFNKNVANNTGWAVDEFGLIRFQNPSGQGLIAVERGALRLSARVAVRDSDAYIHRLSYNVTILGRIVDIPPEEPEG